MIIAIEQSVFVPTIFVVTSSPTTATGSGTGGNFVGFKTGLFQNDDKTRSVFFLGCCFGYFGNLRYERGVNAGTLGGVGFGCCC